MVRMQMKKAVLPAQYPKRLSPSLAPELVALSLGIPFLLPSAISGSHR